MCLTIATLDRGRFLHTAERVQNFPVDHLQTRFGLDRHVVAVRHLIEAIVRIFCTAQHKGEFVLGLGEQL